jgi:hydroxymethylglutaryl-CoA reductase
VVEIHMICMRCRDEYANSSLPMCRKCMIDMKDFDKLVDFLNKFEGDKKDALWLISNEIADRQSMIIGSCKVVYDIENGEMHLEAQSAKQFTQRKIEEIEKLYRAKNILKDHYGI